MGLLRERSTYEFWPKMLYTVNVNQIPDSGKEPGLFYVVIMLFQLCLRTTGIAKKGRKDHMCNALNLP